MQKSRDTNPNPIHSHFVTDEGWLHTHGMEALGLHELEARHIPGFLRQQAARLMREICDYMIENGTRIRAGETMSVSGTRLRFVAPIPVPGYEDHYVAERLPTSKRLATVADSGRPIRTDRSVRVRVGGRPRRMRCAPAKMVAESGNPIVIHPELQFPRISMKPKKAKKSTTPSTCPECGCGVDQPHIGSCGIERCTRCGDKCVSCGRCEGHDPLEAAWTGNVRPIVRSIDRLANRVKEWARGYGKPDTQKQAGILDDLCLMLTSLGIDMVEATYDGAGDQGAVNWISFEPDDVAIPDGLKSLVERFVEAILPLGYEDSDGASGTVTIAPDESPRVEIEHEARIIDFTHEHYSIA